MRLFKAKAERQPINISTAALQQQLNRESQEVEEILKRIQSHKGVVGTIVVNNEGIPVKSTLDNTTTVQYSGLMSQLADKARSVVRDLDPSNDLTFLRVRSKKHEIMVAPDKDFILIVIQNPTD
ncbi:hypothetical protein FF38_12466 [Lucilia cuprina]|uniref:Roadblock/LAMTOR2 domain-containing protein n=1 Tax=Lucilia cuprina TaxID=7375 RepID=A0A0L0CJA6_LUCCU|nr:hypothetical protein FF38_12466 [Lucilia cuprina]